MRGVALGEGKDNSQATTTHNNNNKAMNVEDGLEDLIEDVDIL